MIPPWLVRTVMRHAAALGRLVYKKGGLIAFHGCYSPPKTGQLWPGMSGSDDIRLCMLCIKDLSSILWVAWLATPCHHLLFPTITRGMNASIPSRKEGHQHGRAWGLQLQTSLAGV